MGIPDALSLGETRLNTEAVLGALPEALCVVDATERIALWSPESERLLGHEATELLRDSIERIIPDSKWEEHEEMLALLAQGVVVRDRFMEVVASDGRAKPVLLTAFPIRDEQGTPSGYGLLFREVAPMSEAQSRLALRARVESLGRLVAGVGHEINNPCGFVLANVQHVRRGLEQAGEAAVAAGVPNDAIDALEDAEQGALRIRDLVASMRLFARGRNFERLPVDIRDVIDDAERLAKSDTSNRASLNIDRGPSCLIMGDRVWLSQVILNLLLNAADAFTQDDPADNRISVYWGTYDKNVEIHVVDNGPGIAAGDLEHIFDPFYTTKAPNRGVGLGLSICHDIVARHDGHIRARSETQRGTEICVSLPLASG